MKDATLTPYLNDPALIDTHELALEIIEGLDDDLADITAQIDALAFEYSGRPVPEHRQDWVKRASHTAAIRKNQRYRVIQRDREIRLGMKLGATPQKPPTEERLLNHQRRMIEAEERRLQKQAEIAALQNERLRLEARKAESKTQRTFAHRFYEAARQTLGMDICGPIEAQLRQTA